MPEPYALDNWTMDRLDNGLIGQIGQIGQLDELDGLDK
jgi:hypothetical protein